MREEIKDISVIAAVCAAIALGIFAAIWLFTWWLFTGVFLETDADMYKIPKPPLVFAQYKRQGFYEGYLSDYDYDEDMEYNEYYYHFKEVSFAEYPDFQPVTQESVPEIMTFVQDYEQHLDEIKGRDEDADQLCRRYRYDTGSLSSGDYYRIRGCILDEEPTLSGYTLCIFDHEKNTLYYFEYREA